MARTRYAESKPFHVAGQLLFMPRRRDALKVLLGWNYCFTYRHEWEDAAEVGKGDAHMTRSLQEVPPPWWDLLKDIWPFGR